jgi:hypothetical protein
MHSLVNLWKERRLSVWRKLSLPLGWIRLLLFVSCLLLPSSLTQAQLSGSDPGVDEGTRQTLNQLERLVYTGSEQEIITQINGIIQSAGYVKPLAKIFYNLSFTQSDAVKVMGYYRVILQNWSDSAWAQKAVPEVVSLILQSQGELGTEVETLLWQKQEQLLTPAADAAGIGEEAGRLVTDVRLHLIYLAHFRNNPAQVHLLTQATADSALNQDIVELADAFALIRQENFPEATTRLNQWLLKYPTSSLRAFAMQGVYYAATDQQSRQDALTRMAEAYPDTLEALQIQQNVR